MQMQGTRSSHPTAISPLVNSGSVGTQSSHFAPRVCPTRPICLSEFMQPLARLENMQVLAYA